MAKGLIWFFVAGFFLVTLCQGHFRIVEKGQSTNLQCSFQADDVTDITWQLINGNITTNLSTCSFEYNNCSDLQSSSLYHGYISGYGSVIQMSLNLTKTMVKETEFLCLASNGDESEVWNLEVYAWPSDSHCKQQVMDSYVDYICVINNVYPSVSAVIHRREVDFEKDDFDYNNTYCQYGGYWSGSDGDYYVYCSWRILLYNLPLNNTVDISLRALVSNNSAINNKPVQQAFNLSLSVPTVEISSLSCPSLTTSISDTFVIGKEGRCSCLITSPGNPPSSALWFKDDVIQRTGNVQKPYVELLFNYIYSDPNPVYECRPITSLKATVTSVFFTPKFTENYTFVESLQSISLECNFLKAVNSITWQMLLPNQYEGWQMYSEDDVVNLTTCSFAENLCSDEYSDLYKGSILSGNVVELNISSVKRNETQFRCLADNGLKTNVTQLAVYVWPKNPACTQDVTVTYIDYTCTTDGVYPYLSADLHRKGKDFTESYSDSACTINYENIHKDGSSPATCKWRVPIDRDYMEVRVYVKMRSIYSYTLKVEGRQDAESEDVVMRFNYTEIAIDVKNCPVGPGVKDGRIAVGSLATCRCEVTSRGFPPGTAYWIMENWGYIDHVVNETDGSCTLNINTDKHATGITYICLGLSNMKGNGSQQFYKPLFNSVASQSLFNQLHLFVVVFRFICSKPTSHVF